MASELNHHVGYSRENECWFVRFYPYQTEQQATEAIAEFIRPTPVAPVSPDATGEPWPYQKTFNAIAAATRLEGGCIFISVKDFVEAFGPTPDATGKCGELVTVGYMVSHEEGLGIVEEPVCLRSQAEELLAAEREAQQRLLDIIEEANTDKEALEADNAALTARVKELVAERDEALRGNRYAQLERIATKRAEALEAKLAAAEKALEPFANAADGRKSKSVTGAVCFSQHYLLAARAALGGKPS